MSNKISVVINTYNAGKYLKIVLDSVRAFDEVVVCDMESVDDTINIATQYGCKIVTFPKGEHRICEPARDFAIHSASNDWVLVVDADEIVPAALRQYLYDYIDKSGDKVALAIPRINLFMDKEARDLPDYQLRFFKKDLAKWHPVIHSRPEIDGKIGKVPNKRVLSFRHLDNPSVSSRINKIDRYSDYEVGKRCNRRYGLFDLAFRPMWFFIKSYILGRGFLDGVRGIIKAYLAMVYQIVFVSKIIENQTHDNQSNTLLK